MTDLHIPAPEYTRAVRPSARVETDADELSLNGEWGFRLRGVPEADGTIAVPSHWVLPTGTVRGNPAYTNLVFPIPVDPPHLPQENPTAEYARSVVIPDSWLVGGRILLRTDGIESHAEVFVGGRRAGSRLGSRLVHELDITDLVTPGENEILIVVSQWSVGTYLEDQDQWWLPGIFRDVTLRHRPVGSLDDVWLDTAFDAESGTGEIRPDIRTDGWPVRMQIPECGVDVVFASADDQAVVVVPDVRPWSDESPALYDAIVSTAGESVSLRIGFRSVSVVDGVLIANGRPLKLRGVNRHETHPDRGRVFDEAFVRSDLELMKRHNVNAIRTAHYPPHPRVLDLADEYGFWVMLECDLETHGFELIDWRGNPSDEPAWQPHLLDRIERTVERDKNHACVFSWSLGNESGRGRNLAAMAAWARDRDERRLVVYESDHAAEYTQIYARMYPAFEEIDAFFAESGPIAVAHHPSSEVTDDEARRARALPYLPIEYLHAMGTGPGGIADYERIIAANPRIAGGFLWEWRDHALRATATDGQTFLGYGGDFGEILHDGTFIADGLVSADGVISTGLVEWAQSVAPIRASWDGAAVIASRHLFCDARVAVTWRIEVAGEAVLEGATNLTISAGGSVRVDVPASDVLGGADGREVWVTVEVRHADDAPEWLRGALIHRAQAPLAAAGAVAERTPTALSAPGGELRFGTVRVDGETGAITGIGGLAVNDLGVTLWRAPTDNDLGHGALDYWQDRPEDTLGAGAGRRGASSAERWTEAGLDRIVPSKTTRSDAADAVVFTTRWGAAGAEPLLECVRTWQEVDSRARLRVDIRPLAGAAGIWPRVGIHLALPVADWSASWFGLGPEESYSDMREAAYVGLHERSMAELVRAQVHPQESGHRSDVRTLTLRAPEFEGVDIARIAGELGFSLRPWSPAELTVAGHPHELPEPSASHLLLDLAMHGLGSRSCGPDVRPEHHLRPCELTVTLDVGASS
ncbi:glycoside hydrolase family 2 TIM barrel-domain containing protein [Microbacterium sp. GXF6406]